MRNLFKKTVFYAIYLMGVLLVLPFFIGWKLIATDDLLRKIAEPSYNDDKMFKEGQNVKTVWVRVLKWTYEIDGEWVTKKSMLLKATRLLLVLTIALSVTMILYNGMMYIIQTWQGKEWKDLIKNVLLIVVGILISLFSVVIINLTQSIPNSLSKIREGQSDDDKLMEWKTTSRREIRHSIFGDSDDIVNDEQKKAIMYFYDNNYQMTWDASSWILVLSWTERVPLLDMYENIKNN